MRRSRALDPEDLAPSRWVTIDESPALILDASLGTHLRVRVTAAMTIDPPLNGTSGQEIVLRLEWGATATVTLHALWGLRGDVVLPTASGSVYFLRAIYDEDGGGWDVLGTPNLSTIYDVAGTAAAAIATHEAAGDPHPGYLTEAAAATTYAALVHASRHLAGGADPIFTDESYVVSNETPLRELDRSTMAADLTSIQKLCDCLITLIRDLDAYKKPNL